MELIALSLILFVVGFVCGYGVRGFIARRRRQAARKYSTKNILSSGRRDGALYFHRSSTAIASGLPERLLMSSSNRTR